MKEIRGQLSSFFLSQLSSDAGAGARRLGNFLRTEILGSRKFFFRVFQQQLSYSSADTAAGNDDRRLHTNRVTIHVTTGSKWVGRLK